MLDDLTDNDIVIRQINCSQILRRLLAGSFMGNGPIEDLPRTLVSKDTFEFPGDFYGDTNYWLKTSLPMRLIIVIFMVLYLPMTLVLKSLLMILSPFDKFNIVISLTKKLQGFRKAKLYLSQLI